MRDGENKTTTDALIQREEISTGLGYDVLVAAFEREMGRWDPIAETSLIKQKAPWSRVETAVQAMAGPHGLMIFFHVDQGRLVSLNDGIKRCSLYIVGNGVIAEKILSIDIRASLYVPFRVCLYEKVNSNDAFISLDRPSSFLATLHHPKLTEIGILLDNKIDGVVQSILNSYG